jgi:hypothetical protein
LGLAFTSAGHSSEKPALSLPKAGNPLVKRFEMCLLSERRREADSNVLGEDRIQKINIWKTCSDRRGTL